MDGWRLTAAFTFAYGFDAFHTGFKKWSKELVEMTGVVASRLMKEKGVASDQMEEFKFVFGSSFWMIRRLIDMIVSRVGY